jgi:hypothetical protein
VNVFYLYDLNLRLKKTAYLYRVCDAQTVLTPFNYIYSCRRCSPTRVTS